MLETILLICSSFFIGKTIQSNIKLKLYLSVVKELENKYKLREYSLGYSYLEYDLGYYPHYFLGERHKVVYVPFKYKQKHIECDIKCRKFYQYGREGFRGMYKTFNNTRYIEIKLENFKVKIC